MAESKKSETKQETTTPAAEPTPAAEESKPKKAESKKSETKPKAKTYQVRVSNEFRSITPANRQAAGISVPPTGDGYIGELDADQVKELEDDPYVTVEPYKG